MKPDETTSELCIDTIITYNEGSNIRFDEVSYPEREISRMPPFFLSGIADKKFNFVLKELNNLFSSLDLGDAFIDVGSFKFVDVSKSTLALADPYLTFKSVDIEAATLKATVTNSLGFDVDSVVVTVCDSAGAKLLDFDIGFVEKDYSENTSKTLSRFDYKTFTQYINVKVSGSVDGAGYKDLNKNNKLSVNVEFVVGNGHQIRASDYVGEMLEDTIEETFNGRIKIDHNSNGFSDFDIYSAQTTVSFDNKMELKFENFSSSIMGVSFCFPDVQNSKYVQDTLEAKFNILGKTLDNASRETDKSVSFSNKYLGGVYSGNADLVDTMRVKVKVVFPKSTNFVRATEQKIKIGMKLTSLDIMRMECKVKEDFVFGENSGSIPIELNRLRVTDKQGNEIDTLKMLGEPSISFEMKPIITSKISSVKDIITFATRMKSSSGDKEEVYTDNLLLSVSPSSLFTYKGNFPKQKEFLNLLGILPDSIHYRVSPTIKATDSLLVIEAEKKMNINVHIKSPIIFDTEDDSLIFELRKDYGDGFEGMHKEFHSSRIEQNMYNNYLDGEFILQYNNSSNMLLGAEVIICSDKSVLYDDDIKTNATRENAGKEGFPSYIARSIKLESLQPNTKNGKVSAELLQKDLEPLLLDNSYVGVKISICGSAASFAGDLDLEGKIEFKYNNFGDI